MQQREVNRLASHISRYLDENARRLYELSEKLVLKGEGWS